MIEYKLLPGYLSYRVGSDGSVWSCCTRGCKPQPTGQWKRLRVTRNPKGYLFLNIGRGNPQYVHRLVLLAFRGPSPQGLETRHLDGDKANCRLANLVYGTPVENALDRERHGHQLRGSRVPGSLLTEDQVVEIKRNPDKRAASLAVLYGVTVWAIYSIGQGKNWKHVKV